MRFVHNQKNRTFNLTNGVEYTEYELLDGQQRLTTMLLMLACTRDLAPQYQETLSTFIYQKENPLLQKPERMRILFNIRNDVRDFIDVFVKPMGGTSRIAELEGYAKSKEINISIKNMSNTILVIRGFLEENLVEIGAYLIYFLNKVLMIYVATEELQDILPQHPKPSSQWVHDYAPEERAEWTDKLGNLALISRRKNTAQGNLDYQKKKDKYFKKNVEVFPNSIRVYQSYATWKLSDLKQNHEEVISVLLQAY